MDLVTMILACSLYPDNSVVNAMVQLGSSNNPLKVATVDNTVSNFKTAAQAAQFINQQLQAGKTVDIGLMQIPSHWLASYHVAPADLLQPCKNMVVASQILFDAQVKCVNAETEALKNKSDTKNPMPDPQACALSIYKSGDGQAGSDYANTIINYASAHSFADIEAQARAKNPAGFDMSSDSDPVAKFSNKKPDKARSP